MSSALIQTKMKPSFVMILALLALLFILVVRPGGIGGTGIGDDDGNGGIGGTGIGTGFIGSIEGFGSIIVNGQHIDYEDDMAVTFNTRIGTATELKIGQIVQVLAKLGPDENLHAANIQVYHAVVGPVEAISSEGATISGLTVILPPGAAPVNIGQTLAVSGFRRADDVIIAGRIDPAPAAARSIGILPDRPFGDEVHNLSLSGFVQTAGQGTTLYGYRLTDLANPISTKQIITISGNLNGSTLSSRVVRQTSDTQKTVPEKRAPQSPPQKPQPIKQEIEEQPIVVTPTLPTPKPESAPKLENERPGASLKSTVVERPNPTPLPARPDQQRQELQTDAPSEPRQDTDLQVKPDQDRVINAVESDTTSSENADADIPEDEEDIERTSTLDSEPLEVERETVTDTPDREQTDVPERPEADAPVTDRPTRPEQTHPPERPDRLERPERLERPRR